jgi:hypothetical protein
MIPIQSVTSSNRMKKRERTISAGKYLKLLPPKFNSTNLVNLPIPSGNTSNLFPLKLSTVKLSKSKNAGGREEAVRLLLAKYKLRGTTESSSALAKVAPT